MRTRPLGSSVAVCMARAAAIGPVAVNLPVFGSNSSADATYFEPSLPPAIRMRPSESGVAVCTSRALAIEPVALKVPAFA